MAAVTVAAAAGVATPERDASFWRRAGQYTSKFRDEAFVGEIAYVMVTLHRTGA